jgi:hypothetical protein
VVHAPRDPLVARELEAAIEELYAVFAHRRLPSHVEACSHCVDDADHALLATQPLRLLSTRRCARRRRCRGMAEGEAGQG